MRPTQDEDRKLARELVPNALVFAIRPEPPRGVRHGLVHAQPEKPMGLRRCALCYHDHHLGKCKSKDGCACPD